MSITEKPLALGCITATRPAGASDLLIFLQ